MKLRKALECLGGTRVIWIDDHFNDSPELLGSMLADNVDTTRQCNIPELTEALKFEEFDEAAMRSQIVQALADVNQNRRDEIKAEYFSKEQSREGAPVREMTVEAVRKACELLAIAPNDRWPFEGVEEKIRETCRTGDVNVSYIVDLKDSRGSNPSDKSGLRVLDLLAAEKSKGTAFILTHETTIDAEAKFEQELHGNLETDGHSSFPLCVISKERLAAQSSDEGRMEEAFRVAIKRAGLRRSIHEVLEVAGSKLPVSFKEARTKLLRIAPERLDDHVVKWGEVEGVSELQVIERAITAHMARDIRIVFSGTDVSVSNQRIRSLREIELPRAPAEPDRDLIAFRDAETWDEGNLINAAYSLLACGDVFVADKQAGDTGKNFSRGFVLLIQPCDVQIRSDGKRSVRTGVLAPLKLRKDREAGAETVKEYDLPCTIDGLGWVCDLRDATTVDLQILDLSTFRSDGRVQYELDQAKPVSLLPGQEVIFAERTNWLANFIREQASLTAAPEDGPARPRPSAPGASSVAELEARATDASPMPVVARGDPTAVHDAPAAVPAPESTSAISDVQDPVAAERKRRKEEEKARKAAARLAADPKNALMAEIARLKADAATVRRMQLAFAAPDSFKLIEAGSYQPGTNPTDASPPIPASVSWSLVRYGRIRMPFAADILDRYVKVINRTAFDVDFVEPAHALPVVPQPETQVEVG